MSDLGTTERKRLDLVEHSARPLSKRPCQDSNKKEMSVAMQEDVMKELESNYHNMSSDVGSWMEHTCSYPHLNTMPGVKSRVDPPCTQSPAV